MKSGLSFLVAARQCEIGELEQLAHTSDLVALIGRFTHALQRERGMSNIFLASGGRRFGEQRLLQITDCKQMEQEVRAHLETLDSDASRVRNGARLFSRIAVVLHSLDGLGALRTRIADHALSPRESTESYVRLITGLLAVVFEAADSATDPEISRMLVAMFNFMQGKELAGQERAFGAVAFTSGKLDAAGQHHWRHLIESQEACFQVFAEFSGGELRAAAEASQEDSIQAELERLRRVGITLDVAGTLDPDLYLIWYECCTRRIDAMRTVEDLLAMHLRILCESRIAQARIELRDHQTILDTLSRQASVTPPDAAAYYGHNLERSIFEMVQEQSRRLQAMSDELDTVRTALNERKLVERAKGLLMAHRQLSEQEAYKMLREMAMNQKRRIVEVAEALLAMADMLPKQTR
jgi:hypothetical protein